MERASPAATSARQETTVLWRPQHPSTAQQGRTGRRIPQHSYQTVSRVRQGSFARRQRPLQPTALEGAIEGPLVAWPKAAAQRVRQVITAPAARSIPPTAQQVRTIQAQVSLPLFLASHAPHPITALWQRAAPLYAQSTPSPRHQVRLSVTFALFSPPVKLAAQTARVMQGTTTWLLPLAVPTYWQWQGQTHTSQILILVILNSHHWEQICFHTR